MSINQQVIELNNKIIILQSKLDNITQFTVPQRIVCALKRIWPQSRGTFDLPVSKGTLALRVGIQQETLSRNIQKIEPLGVRLIGSSVIVYDNDLARHKVCDHCAAAKICKGY